MFEYLQPVFLKVHLKNDWNSCTLRSRKILLNSICLISFHVTYFLLTLLPHYLRIYTWEYDGNHNSQEGTGLDRPRPCFARICSRHACWLVPIRDITNIIYYILFVPFSHRCPHVHISWYHVFPSKNAVKAYISQSNMHNVCIVLVLGRAFSMLSCTIDWPRWPMVPIPSFKILHPLFFLLATFFLKVVFFTCYIVLNFFIRRPLFLLCFLLFLAIKYIFFTIFPFKK